MYSNRKQLLIIVLHFFDKFLSTVICTILVCITTKLWFHNSRVEFHLTKFIYLYLWSNVLLLFFQMKHKDSTPTSVEAGGGHGSKPIKEGLVSQIASKFQQHNSVNNKEIPSANPMIVRKKSDSILVFNKTSTSSMTSSIPSSSGN